MGETTLKRRKQILETINAQGKISVNELAEIYKVSAVTIRNDLDALSTEGKILRMHGLAQSFNLQSEVKTLRYADELPFIDKEKHNQEIKKQLAERAVDFIQDYDTIVLDSGTTIFELSKEIAKRSWTRLTVLTTSLPICQLLANHLGIEVILLGGRLRSHSLSFAGALTEHMLHNLRFSKLFFGADGIHFHHGITTHYEDESSLNRLMVSMASEVYVLADHTKFGRQSSNWICNFETPDAVITNSKIRKEYVEHYQKSLHVKLVIV